MAVLEGCMMVIDLGYVPFSCTLNVELITLYHSKSLLCITAQTVGRGRRLRDDIRAMALGKRLLSSKSLRPTDPCVLFRYGYGIHL